MRGLDQPEPGSITHDPWTAGCFQSPARTTLSLHVSCFLSASLCCPLLFPSSSVRKESACNVGEPSSIPGSGRSPWRRERPPTPVFWPGEFHGLYSLWGHKESDMTEQFSPYQPGLPGGSMVKNLSTNAGDMGSIPRPGISPGEGNGNPLHFSSLGNPMDRQKGLVGYSPPTRKQQKEQ